MKIALKATALIILTLKSKKGIERQPQEHLNPEAVFVPCVRNAGSRGAPGKGQAGAALESMSGLGCSLNILPLVSVYISSESDYITTIFSRYTHTLSVYIPL